MMPQSAELQVQLGAARGTIHHLDSGACLCSGTFGGLCGADPLQWEQVTTLILSIHGV